MYFYLLTKWLGSYNFQFDLDKNMYKSFEVALKLLFSKTQNFFFHKLIFFKFFGIFHLMLCPKTLFITVNKVKRNITNLLYQFLLNCSHWNTKANSIKMACCIIWPAFGCCAPQTLVEICFFNVFCAKKLKKGKKSKRIDSKFSKNMFF